jgi:hypothetical protein
MSTKHNAQLTCSVLRTVLSVTSSLPTLFHPSSVFSPITRDVLLCVQFTHTFLHFYPRVLTSIFPSSLSVTNISMTISLFVLLY